MSCWTYVKGVIEVDGMGRTQPEVEYILKTVLDHLPKVTGSERNMDIYLNQEASHNQSCSHNEFGEWGRNRLYELQTCYLITVDGSLRDRLFEQTFREFMHWLTVLAKRASIDNCVVSISGYSEEGEFKKVVVSPDNLDDLFEWPSWVTGKPAWWEYLCWEGLHDNKGQRYVGKPDFPDGRCLALMTKREREAFEKKHKKARV